MSKSDDNFLLALPNVPIIILYVSRSGVIILGSQYKLSGIAFTVYGALSSIIFLGVYAFGGLTLSKTINLPWLVLVKISIMLVVNFLSFLCGIYLLKQNKTVHNIAMPLSVILLLSIPFGTIVGSLYLIQRFSQKTDKHRR